MEPEDSLSIYLVILFVLILVNAFFAMSEVAIITLNDNKIRKMAQEGDKKAGILVGMISEPSRFLATIQVGVTLSGFLASAVAADTFAQRIVYAARYWAVSSTVVRVISLVVVTLALSYVTLVFGELVPKRVGMRHCENIALAVARPLKLISALEKPFVWLLSGSTNAVLRLMRIDPNQVPEQVTEEEIRMMIDVGEESGSIQEQEKDMINNIFEFNDRSASEVMVHRTEVVALEADTPLDEIIATALDSGYSRIPVYEDSIDDIKGILYVKDLLERVLKAPDESFKLEEYLREPLYVLESQSCLQLLSDFQQKKVQIAVVVDEYGGTSGLVTMEDLLESIVGNIQDEYDDEDEDISPITETLFLLDGLTDLEEVEKYFHIELDQDEDEEFETIGGYIVHHLGQIPAEGQHPCVEIGGVRFTVDAVDERRIVALRAEVLPPPEQEEKSAETVGARIGRRAPRTEKEEMARE